MARWAPAVTGLWWASGDLAGGSMGCCCGGDGAILGILCRQLLTGCSSASAERCCGPLLWAPHGPIARAVTLTFWPEIAWYERGCCGAALLRWRAFCAAQPL